MRHRVFGRKLGRDKSARKALFRSLLFSLILRGEIKTTEAKAKAIKGLVDKLVNRAKQKTLQARKVVFAFLQNKKVVNKLVDEIAPKFANRPSGFTRILRLGKREGDQAMIVKMEFVEGIEKELPAVPAEKELKPVKQQKLQKPKNKTTEKKGKTKVKK